MKRVLVTALVGLAVWVPVAEASLSKREARRALKTLMGPYYDPGEVDIGRCGRVTPHLVRCRVRYFNCRFVYTVHERTASYVVKARGQGCD